MKASCSGASRLGVPGRGWSCRVVCNPSARYRFLGTSYLRYTATDPNGNGCLSQNGSFITEEQNVCPYQVTSQPGTTPYLVSQLFGLSLSELERRIYSRHSSIPVCFM